MTNKMLRFIALLAATTLVFSVTVDARFGKHFAGKHLSFLANVSAEDKKQLFDILTNFNITKAEKQTQLELWAADQSEDVQAKLSNLTQSKQQAITNAFAKAATNLSEDAATLLGQIQEVVADQDISILEECNQIQALISTADPSVAQQLHIPHIPCSALNRNNGHAKIFGFKQGFQGVDGL